MEARANQVSQVIQTWNNGTEEGHLTVTEKLLFVSTTFPSHFAEDFFSRPRNFRILNKLFQNRLSTNWLLKKTISLLIFRATYFASKEILNTVKDEVWGFGESLQSNIPPSVLVYGLRTLLQLFFRYSEFKDRLSQVFTRFEKYVGRVTPNFELRALLKETEFVLRFKQGKLIRTLDLNGIFLDICLVGSQHGNLDSLGESSPNGSEVVQREVEKIFQISNRLGRMAAAEMDPADLALMLSYYFNLLLANCIEFSTRHKNYEPIKQIHKFIEQIASSETKGLMLSTQMPSYINSLLNIQDPDFKSKYLTHFLENFIPPAKYCHPQFLQAVLVLGAEVSKDTSIQHSDWERFLNQLHCPEFLIGQTAFSWGKFGRLLQRPQFKALDCDSKRRDLLKIVDQKLREFEPDEALVQSLQKESGKMWLRDLNKRTGDETVRGYLTSICEIVEID